MLHVRFELEQTSGDRIAWICVGVGGLLVGDLPALERWWESNMSCGAWSRGMTELQKCCL